MLPKAPVLVARFLGGVAVSVLEPSVGRIRSKLALPAAEHRVQGAQAHLGLVDTFALSRAHEEAVRTDHAHLVDFSGVAVKFTDLSSRQSVTLFAYE